MRKRLLFTVCMFVCGIMAMQAQVRYVAEGGTGDGKSWATASGDIQAMINELAEGDGGDVWVKAGIYLPTEKVADMDKGNEGEGVAPAPTTDRDKAFRIKKNVSLYGGFPAAQATPSWAMRDPVANVTILSGALDNTDRAYHVVVAVGDLGSARLDGFTITKGGGYDDSSGSTATKMVVPVDGVDMSRYDGAGLVVLQTNGSRLKVSNVVIKDNEGMSAAGFLFDKNSAVEMSKSVIEDNSSLKNAGGAGLVWGCDVVFSDVTIRNNYALASTGGISISGGTAVLTRVSVENNSTDGPMGGMYLRNNTKAFFNNVNIKDNVAGGSYAGILIQGISPDSQFNNVEITGNTGTNNGGGLALVSAGDIQNVKFKFITVEGNKAASGGGIYLEGTTLTMENCNISDNEASVQGGGIHIGGNTNLDIINSEITGNKAVNYGAAIQCNAKLTGTNLLIAGNELTSTSSTGTAVAANNVSLTNSTIVGNHAAGANGVGGVIANAQTVLQNCIVWGNTNGNGVSNIKINATGGSLSHSLIEGYNNVEGLDGTDLAITAKNIFADYDNGDYSLLPWITNPVVDKGNDAYTGGEVIKDLAGNARFEGTVDLGAYEAQDVNNPFTGGKVNFAGEQEFTYDGQPVDLRLKTFSSVDYSWVETGAYGDNGVGLPTQGGVYTVTAETAEGEITSTTVRINKAKLPIEFDEVAPMLVGDNAALTASTIPNIGIVFSSSDDAETVVTLTGTDLTANGEGVADITASLQEDRNYTSDPVVRSAFVQNQLDTDAGISGITVNGFSAQKVNQGVYSVSIPYTASADIKVIPTSSKADIEGNVVETVDVKDNGPYDVKVTSEDGQTEETATLAVYVQSNDASIDAITVGGVVATSTDGVNYVVSIAYTDQATLAVTTVDNEAVIEGGNNPTLTLRKGENIRTVTIVSEDGTVSKDYHVTITVQNNNAYLSGITVDGIAATEDGTDYSITLPYCTSANIIATALDSKANVSGSQGIQTLTPGEKTFTYTVTSEDGQETNTYTLTVYVTNNDASVSSITVGGRAVTFSNNCYSITLPKGTTSTAIAVNVTCPKATVTGHGTKSLSAGENRFPVMVTAEDGTQSAYEVVITVSQTSNPGTDPGEEPTPPVVTNHTLTIETMPSGVTINPGTGQHSVRTGSDQTITVTIDATIEGMYVFLKIDDDYHLLNADNTGLTFTYPLTGISKDMKIGVALSDNPDPNPDPTGNVKVESGSTIRTNRGMLHIETMKQNRVFIYTMQGKLFKEQRLAEGETVIQLPDGLYVVALQDRTVAKVVIRN